MLSIICNATLGDEDSFRYSSCYPALADEDHLKNLFDHQDMFQGIIREAIDTFGQLSEPILRLERLKNFLKANLSPKNRREYVGLAISCLQLFAQANWLGPVPTELLNLPPVLQHQHKSQLFESSVFCLSEFFPLRSKYDDFMENVREVLSMDGESLFSIVKCPHLMLVAKLVFLELRNSFSDIQYFDWWSLRAVYLYQQLFEERSATLTKIAASLLKTIEETLSTQSKAENSVEYAVLFASIVFNLEAGHVNYQIYNWAAGQENFRKALSMSELNYEFIGLYGKRTKYQQKDLAQLFLKVESTNTTEKNKHREDFFNNLVYSNSDLAPKYLPKNVALNDENLLEKIKITNKEDEEKLNSNRKSNQLEQIVLLSCLYDYQKNNPQHELTLEEISPMIEYLLSQPQNWCAQICSLFMRGRFESKNSRRMERSLYQMENLCDSYRQPSEQPPLKHRLPFFYSVSYPPFWNAQRELAKIYMQIGMINSSLDIYLNLKMWDDVIVCYQALDKRDKAEEIIRQQLAVKETPDLYCSLGEATRDEQHFRKAIELSDGRSARAYRLLAKFYFSKQQYDEAIVNFEKSLEINSMQYDAWFMLGSAAFRSEKWQISIKAFRSCTSLDPDNYQNWNNLAAAYIKLKEKDKAYSVFQEALKMDYENWKIWENFLWTSADCGYFEDVIKAYHRLLDLKEKYLEVDVLKALSSAVRNQLSDANDVPIVKYGSKVTELFGRLSSLAVNDWQVYWYYADVVLSLAIATRGQNSSGDCNSNQVELDSQSADKYFGLLMKAFRSLYNQSNWELSVDKCKEVVCQSTEILKKCNQYGKYASSPRDALGSLQLSVRGIISKLKQKYEVDEASSASGYISLLHLKELNNDFASLQAEFDAFKKNFFAT